VRTDAALHATDWDEAFRGADDSAGCIRAAVAWFRREPSSEALAATKTAALGLQLDGSVPVVMVRSGRSPAFRISRCREARAQCERPEQLGTQRNYAQPLAAAKSAAVVLVLDEPDCAVETNGAPDLRRSCSARMPAVPRAEVILPIAQEARHESRWPEQRYYQAKPAPGDGAPAAPCVRVSSRSHGSRK